MPRLNYEYYKHYEKIDTSFIQNRWDQIAEKESGKEIKNALNWAPKERFIYLVLASG